MRTTQTAVKSSWVRPRRLKLSTGITEICGLVKPRTAAYKNLVGTDNEHVLMVSRYLLCLGLCEGERTVGSSLSIDLEDALDCLLVHQRRFDANL